AALEGALRELGGAPAIIVGNAGEVNAGDFDPIDALADLADRYDAWLHIDGAFGLFARATPRAAHLAKGVERASSAIADGHKWLNVPYDSGFAFVRDASLLACAFAIGGAYLPKPGEHPMFGAMGTSTSSSTLSASSGRVFCPVPRFRSRECDNAGVTSSHEAVAQTEDRPRI